MVMYGGVSLCIYINGIAQELLNMVRATAEGDQPGTLRYADDQLSRVERVYRRLGRLLTDERAPGESAGDTDPVRTRFAVDILSGTSAGGINSIFLAKALANDEQMDQLKQLWMSEADIAKLINDNLSTRDTGLARPAAPEALLNGQRMYQKLVAAFDGMDEPVKHDLPRRPLVPELDLFVTATDIAGVPLPLRLADSVVFERRHRGVFHFSHKYDEDEKARRNDFAREYNPFLAFAARCTSAFPFAFEPMRLDDIDAVLDTIEGRRGQTEGRAKDSRWDDFLERFRTPPGVAAVDPRKRAFGDGGYLDNKPFSYAAESLLRREGGVPVDRKLIYIEPAPEHPERDPARAERRPDAIENVMAATVGLPRYETIREDLERVMARNRLTERVRVITHALEQDIEHAQERKGREATAAWGQRYVPDMVKIYGFPYGSYHRLRVAATTDWLAKVVSRAAGIGDGSDLVLGVRHLVRAWRNARFSPVPTEGAEPKRSENQFLLDYDLDFRIRRIGYLLSKINTFVALGEDEHRALLQITGSTPSPEEEAEFRAELVELKGELHPLYRRMIAARERLEARGASNPFHARMEELSSLSEDLTRLLKLSGRPQEEEAGRLLREGKREPLVQQAADEVQQIILGVRRPASDVVDQLKEENHPRELAAGARIARRLLWHYYDYYSDYDLVAFPILYSTEAGEEDTVDIIRISPEDAVFVFDEKRDARGRKKLAGTALFSFGGFLQENWRANDILWGRLDGAERIICSLLTDPRDRALRDGLLEEVSLAILRDEFKEANRDEVSRLMAESLVSVAAGRTETSAVSRVASRIGNDQLGNRLAAVFGECLDEREVLAYFREAYEVNRELDPQASLTSLARGTRVVGRMLEGITERHSRHGGRMQWLTRTGSWFWSLVQVAVPRSLPALVFDHWMGLLYAFALLLILLGVFAGAEVMGWGIRALGAMLLANVIVLFFRDFMRRRGRVGAVLVGLGAAAGALVVAAGTAWLARQLFTPSVLAAFPGWLQPWLRVAPVQALSGVLGVLMLLGGMWALLRRPWARLLPGGFASPALAAEFPADVGDLTKLTRGVLLDPIPQKPNETDAEMREREERERVRREHRERLPRTIVRGLYADYVFVAAYWILFVLLAAALVRLALGTRGGFVDLAALDRADLALLLAGLGAVLAGTAAAVMDVVENGRIHEAFTAGRGREEEWMARGIRLAAGWKWGLVFATVLLLSPLFFAAGMPYGPILGAYFVAVSVIGAWAAVARPRVLEWAFPALGAGLVAAAFVLGEALHLFP